MSLGMILLVVLALLILFGVVMERMARGKTDGSTLQGGQSA